MPRVSLGLDFGTESARAVVVDVDTGTTIGCAVTPYINGVISARLPGGGVDAPHLPTAFALQHPGDWLAAASSATRSAVSSAEGNIGVACGTLSWAGIGVAFTSCTALPATATGGALCCTSDTLHADAHAWPKLWKHHSAGVQAAAEAVNAAAVELREPWLHQYGGGVGLEWLLPKLLEVQRSGPRVFAAADLWVEAGDWMVWLLCECVAWNAGAPGCDATLPPVRSTCNAGFKGCWSAASGWPSDAFFECLGVDCSAAARLLRGRFLAPGARAGGLSPAAAAALGLPSHTPVSAGIIDAHAGLLGSGVGSPGALVLVMGTSACHLALAECDAAVPSRVLPGSAGVVRDGIVQGLLAIETGQAAVGDAYAWAARTLAPEPGAALGRCDGEVLAALTALAAAEPPGAGGVLALDWLNGARTPLMDARLSGAFLGVTIGTRPAQLFRALLEASALGLRWITDGLRDGGVRVDRFVASGGLPARSPLLMQIVADVLGARVEVARAEQPVAVGAAVLGCVAGGAGGGIADVVARFAQGGSSDGSGSAEPAALRVYTPCAAHAARYEQLYVLYRSLAADPTLLDAMRALSVMANEAQ